MWKKSYRKVRDRLLKKLDALNSNDFLIAASKKISITDISSKRYAHLGITMNNEKLLFPTEIIPDARQGRFSSQNLYGKELKRTDMPMVQKTFTWDVPNYGDWSNGWHEASRTRKVYLREFIPPKKVS